MIPLPNTFWQDPTFTVPAPDLFEPIENPPAYTPVAASTPPPVVLPTATPSPSPEPKQAFDPKHLRQSLHNNLASVFTGDLPYLLLKSGDRLYPGSRLTSDVTLEAITPDGVLCATPMGILKISPKPDMGNEEVLPALENDSPPALRDVATSEEFSIPQHPQTH
jgi:hypothetical protein